MAADEKRLMKMIYLLSQAEGYLTAGELAKELNLSERTVKGDAERLREFLGSCGCTLESVRGKGYTLHVDEPARFEQTRELVHILFNNVDSGVKEPYPFQLARAILCLENADPDGYFRLEQLADRLYVSASTLKKRMPWVREFMESFGLSLVSRPGRGLKVCGDELSQRLCILELYENHFRKRVVAFNNRIYERAFADRGDKDQIRKRILDTIRRSENELLDSYCNRLVDYFLLQRNRAAQGRRIRAQEEPWPGRVRELKERAEWEIAARLADALNEIEGYEIRGDGELAAIAVLILIWGDWDGADRLAERFPALFDRAGEVSRELTEDLAQKWDFPDIPDDSGKEGPHATLRRALRPELLRLFIQQKFGYSRCWLLGNAISDNDIKNSPLMMSLADGMGEYLRRHCELEVSEFNTQLLAVAVYRAVDSITYGYVPRRLLICARNGKCSARVIQNDVCRRLGSWWVGRITVAPLYEARKFPESDYDAMIGTFYPSAYRYAWPYVKIHSPMEPEDYEKVRREVVLPGYDLAPTAQAVGWDVLEFHRAFPAADIRSLLLLLAYQWGAALQDKERLAAFFSDPHHLRPRNHLLMATVPHVFTGKQIFDLYLLNRPLDCGGESVHAVCFLSLTFRGNLLILRFLEHSLRILQAESGLSGETLTPENLMEDLAEGIRKCL